MKESFLSFDDGAREDATEPKPGEIAYGIGIMIAVHLAIALMVVVGLEALGIA